jgi:hypothetical protein
MPAICTTRDGNDHSCEVSLKSGQQFDLNAEGQMARQKQYVSQKRHNSLKKK